MLNLQFRMPVDEMCDNAQPRGAAAAPLAVVPVKSVDVRKPARARWYFLWKRDAMFRYPLVFLR